MSGDTEIELHSKRFTDFHILRIIRARKHSYNEPITAFLSDVFIYANSAVGIVYGHVNQGPHGRYADEHLLRTSDIRQVRKEGRFWVLNTMDSRYVIASFKRNDGRASFRSFLRRAKCSFQ
jgi:hypothetical protein